MSADVRMQVLDTARSLIMEKWYAEKECATSNWENTRDHNGRAPSDLQLPPFPAEDQIMEMAERFYNFIQS